MAEHRKWTVLASSHYSCLARTLGAAEFRLPMDRRQLWYPFRRRRNALSRRGGIHFCNIRYWSDTLAADVGRQRANCSSSMTRATCRGSSSAGCRAGCRSALPTRRLCSQLGGVTAPPSSPCSDATKLPLHWVTRPRQGGDGVSIQCNPSWRGTRQRPVEGARPRAVGGATQPRRIQHAQFRREEF
jgi:hypothetical protein